MCYFSKLEIHLYSSIQQPYFTIQLNPDEYNISFLPTAYPGSLLESMVYFNIKKWHISPPNPKCCFAWTLIGACRDTHCHTSLTGGHTWGMWQGRGRMNPGLKALQSTTTICHKPKTRQTTQGLFQWKNRAVPKKCRRKKNLLALVQHLGRQMVREREISFTSLHFKDSALPLCHTFHRCII